MFRSSTLTIGITYIALVAVSAGAQTPTLSGTWKLNVAKSDFGAVPPPKSMTVNVTIRNEKVRLVVASVTADDQAQTYEMDVATDGRPVVNEKDGTSDSAQWEGNTLVLEHNSENFMLVRRVTMSDNGRTVTSKSVFKPTSGREVVTTEIFERQP